MAACMTHQPSVLQSQQYLQISITKDEESDAKASPSVNGPQLQHKGQGQRRGEVGCRQLLDSSCAMADLVLKIAVFGGLATLTFPDTSMSKGTSRSFLIASRFRHLLVTRKLPSFPANMQAFPPSQWRAACSLISTATGQKESAGLKGKQALRKGQVRGKGQAGSRERTDLKQRAE